MRFIQFYNALDAHVAQMPPSRAARQRERNRFMLRFCVKWALAQVLVWGLAMAGLLLWLSARGGR